MLSLIRIRHQEKIDGAEDTGTAQCAYCDTQVDMNGDNYWDYVEFRYALVNEKWRAFL